MNRYRNAYALLFVGLLFLLVALYGQRASQVAPSEPSGAQAAADVPVRREKLRYPAGETLAPKHDAVRADRAKPGRIAAQGVSPELLSVLHACMAPSELRPSAGAAPDLSIDHRLLDDCLRGADAMGVLTRLSTSLSALRDPDRDDAVLLMGYLAHRLLRDASTAEERSAIVDPLLAGYRTVKGPELREVVEWLLARAYVRKDDLSGVARQIQLALERELDSGAAPHVLGPLLGESYSAPRSTKRPLETMGSAEARRAEEALGAMKQVVERAAPRAIESGLAAMRTEGQPYELRDAFLLLENALFAAPNESKAVLDAMPRLLDDLAALDLDRIRKSGIELRTLSGLLSQAESRMLMAGAEDLEEVPSGGRTSPADLRRRWLMQNERVLGGVLFGPEHARNRPPEFR